MRDSRLGQAVSPKSVLATVTRQVRPLRVHSGKGLTACPAESEHPGTEINSLQELQSLEQTT